MDDEFLALASKKSGEIYLAKDIFFKYYSI